MGDTRQGIHRWLLLLYSVAFLGWATYRALTLRLWFDELITVYLAMLPGPSRLWEALESLADGIPPLYHLIVHAIFRMAGPSALAARLPSMIGLWVMTLCLFAFVSRRCGPWYGWVALLAAIATPAAPFAYEARPYGLMLGLAGLSLLAWRAAGGRGWRRVAGVTGLAACLAMAMLSHYYAVLLFPPLALGEAARAVERRRLDLWTWLAMAAGGAPLIAFMPLARDLSATLQSTFFSQPEALSLPEGYGGLLGRLTPALVAITLAFGWRCTRPPRPGAIADGYEPPPWNEYVMAAGFVALPAIAFVLAVAVTGAWVERYLLASCLGFGILAAFVAHRLAVGRPGPARLSAIVLLTAAVAGMAGDARDEAERSRPPDSLTFPLKFAHDTSSPIVVCYPDLYFQLVYYAPEVLQPRLFYVSGDVNTAEINLERLMPFAPVQVIDLRDFLRQQVSGRFLLYGRADDWLLPSLIVRGARMELDYVLGTTFVATVTGPRFVADRPPAASPADAP